MESSMLYMSIAAGLAASLCTFVMSGANPGYAPFISDVAGFLLGLSTLISVTAASTLDI
jgi:hypothetical protein